MTISFCWWFRNPVNSLVEGKVVEIPWFTTGFYTSKRWFDSLWLPPKDARLLDLPALPRYLQVGVWWKVCRRKCCQNKNSPFSNWTGSKGPFGFLCFFLSLWIRHPAFRNNFFGHAAFLEGVHQMSVNIGCIGSPKPRSLSQLWKDFCWKTLHRTFRSALPQTNSLHLKKCIVGIQVSCLGGQFSGASFRCLFGMNTNLSHVLF